MENSYDVNARYETEPSRRENCSVDSVASSLLSIINEVRASKGDRPIEAITPVLRWREDLGFVSLDLAELTVRVEERFGIDIFSDGLVATVGEVVSKIDGARRM